ncbi:DUF2087 domain-containing protein [Martelella endophytica]|uniref:DUF2087 domain-containing protein n=1 Tax=Martelella endophytica TaxID=1486262 RepID=A0A0D5LQ45_MAREN|nr:DUF2087 domain-containing protein [Martelella endophytica]AJY46060.1 hypothetical protein TM49_10845 [Martelella endophytica]
MSKEKIPLLADDLSAFTRALSHQLGDSEGTPSHLSLMNMLARSGGFRNFQHLRAAHAAEKRLARPEQPVVADFRLVERALQQFDHRGKLKQWPSRRTVQSLSLWAFWALMPASADLSEPSVNALLNAYHLFGDAAQLRRSMVEHGLVTRKRDCSSYRRVEQRLTAEAAILIARLKARRTAA